MAVHVTDDDGDVVATITYGEDKVVVELLGLLEVSKIEYHDVGARAGGHSLAGIESTSVTLRERTL